MWGSSAYEDQSSGQFDSSSILSCDALNKITLRKKPCKKLSKSFSLSIIEEDDICQTNSRSPSNELQFLHKQSSLHLVNAKTDNIDEETEENLLKNHAKSNKLESQQVSKSKVKKKISLDEGTVELTPKKRKKKHKHTDVEAEPVNDTINPSKFSEEIMETLSDSTTIATLGESSFTRKNKKKHKHDSLDNQPDNYIVSSKSYSNTIIETLTNNNTVDTLAKKQKNKHKIRSTTEIEGEPDNETIHTKYSIEKTETVPDSTTNATISNDLFLKKIKKKHRNSKCLENQLDHDTISHKSYSQDNTETTDSTVDTLAKKQKGKHKMRCKQQPVREIISGQTTFQSHEVLQTENDCNLVNDIKSKKTNKQSTQKSKKVSENCVLNNDEPSEDKNEETNFIIENLNLVTKNKTKAKKSSTKSTNRIYTDNFEVTKSKKNHQNDNLTTNLDLVNDVSFPLYSRNETPNKEQKHLLEDNQGSELNIECSGINHEGTNVCQEEICNNALSPSKKSKKKIEKLQQYNIFNKNESVELVQNKEDSCKKQSKNCVTFHEENVLVDHYNKSSSKNYSMQNLPNNILTKIPCKINHEFTSKSSVLNEIKSQPTIKNHFKALEKLSKVSVPCSSKIKNFKNLPSLSQEMCSLKKSKTKKLSKTKNNEHESFKHHNLSLNKIQQDLLNEALKRIDTNSIKNNVSTKSKDPSQSLGWKREKKTVQKEKTVKINNKMTVKPTIGSDKSQEKQLNSRVDKERKIFKKNKPNTHFSKGPKLNINQIQEDILAAAFKRLKSKPMQRDSVQKCQQVQSVTKTNNLELDEKTNKNEKSAVLDRPTTVQEAEKKNLCNFFSKAEERSSNQTLLTPSKNKYVEKINKDNKLKPLVVRKTVIKSCSSNKKSKLKHKLKNGPEIDREKIQKELLAAAFKSIK